MCQEYTWSHELKSSGTIFFFLVNPEPKKHCEATELTGRSAEKNNADLHELQRMRS